MSHLSEILVENRKSIDKGDLTDASVRVIEFHIKFVDLCQNNMIVAALKNCYDKLYLLSSSIRNMETLIQSFGEHEEILSALKSGKNGFSRG